MEATAQDAGVNIHQVAQREEFLWQYKKVVTKLRADSVALKIHYEMVQDDQYITPNTTVAEWLIKNQNKVMNAENLCFMDFQAPIEIEAMILPNSIL